jgi:hypothetical protein
MTLRKKPSSKPSSKDEAKEKAIEEIVRDADLKKFDPELEDLTHPSKPAEDQ